MTTMRELELKGLRTWVAGRMRKRARRLTRESALYASEGDRRVYAARVLDDPSVDLRFSRTGKPVGPIGRRLRAGASYAAAEKLYGNANKKRRGARRWAAAADFVKR